MAVIFSYPFANQLLDADDWLKAFNGDREAGHFGRLCLYQGPIAGNTAAAPMPYSTTLLVTFGTIEAPVEFTYSAGRLALAATVTATAAASGSADYWLYYTHGTTSVLGSYQNGAQAQPAVMGTDLANLGIGPSVSAGADITLTTFNIDIGGGCAA